MLEPGAQRVKNINRKTYLDPCTSGENTGVDVSHRLLVVLVGNITVPVLPPSIHIRGNIFSSIRTWFL